MALSAASVGLGIKLSHNWGLLDAPDGMRKTQAIAIPKTGGVAAILAFAVVLIVASTVALDPNQTALLLLVLIPTLGAAGLGVVDDFRPLSPRIRLVVQILLSAFVWQFGTQINAPSEFLSFALTVLWLTAVINAMNMLDNTDGLAGIIIFISSLAFAFLSLYVGQTLVASLAFAVSGAIGGFLVFNWWPASIYLGDGGAYFFGMLLAILSIRFSPVNLDQTSSLIAVCLLLGVPMMDLVFVVFSRLRRGIHPFTAGKDHLSHRLQDKGLTVVQSVFTLAIVHILLVVLGSLIVLFVS
jgi:UDP-GlcNAc:undecaprenyl-phosphate GlcNAc-1-phosphate transferase